MLFGRQSAYESESTNDIKIPAERSRNRFRLRDRLWVRNGFRFGKRLWKGVRPRYRAFERYWPPATAADNACLSKQESPLQDPVSGQNLDGELCLPADLKNVASVSGKPSSMGCILSEHRLARLVIRAAHAFLTPPLCVDPLRDAGAWPFPAPR
jgi:hypothetical protein